ncbi:hypothetical protein PUN28_020641 [Cardiocondyla obscurior]|uniref:Secreted protein n=1 Tax=Cardiocondyla obscurior TaxID=286306 RepID=A0AAW2E8V8_9HYME
MRAMLMIAGFINAASFFADAFSSAAPAERAADGPSCDDDERGAGTPRLGICPSGPTPVLTALTERDREGKGKERKRKNTPNPQTPNPQPTAGRGTNPPYRPRQAGRLNSGSPSLTTLGGI